MSLNMGSLKAKIRQARVHAGFSQPELANKLGVSSRTVQRYETDDDSVSKIPLNTALRIAELCNVNFIWLVSSQNETEQDTEVKTDVNSPLKAENSKLVEKFTDQATVNQNLQNMLKIEKSNSGTIKLSGYIQGLADGVE